MLDLTLFVLFPLAVAGGIFGVLLSIDLIWGLIESLPSIFRKD